MSHACHMVPEMKYYDFHMLLVKIKVWLGWYQLFGLDTAVPVFMHTFVLVTIICQI